MCFSHEQAPYQYLRDKYQTKTYTKFPQNIEELELETSKRNFILIDDKMEDTKNSDFVTKKLY